MATAQPLAVINVTGREPVAGAFTPVRLSSTTSPAHPGRLLPERRPFDLYSGHLSMTPPIEFATCDLCDQYKTDTTGALRVLPPVFRDFGARRKFAGPVTTVKCHEDNSLVKAAVESPGLGRVLVVDGGGSLRRALLGGNLGGAAARNGWAGVVIDGCVRDLDELAVFDVGIRALAAFPLPTERRDEGQRDVPVFVQGVCVRPGDWLYADADGMVVLPAPDA